MQVALSRGTLYIRADETGSTTIKSLSGVKFDKKNKLWYAPCSLDMLDRLGRLCRLPPTLEKERDKLRRIRADTNAERLNDNPTPLFDYPVRVKLFRHQIRAANMAMTVFEWR